LKNSSAGRQLSLYSAAEVIQKSRQIADAFGAKGSTVVLVRVHQAPMGRLLRHDLDQQLRRRDIKTIIFGGIATK